MPLSAETLSAFLPLMEDVSGQFELMPEEAPPSASAWIKGALRTYLGTLKTIQAALEQREPKAGDQKDIEWIVVCLGALLQEKWVQDQMKGTPMNAPDAKLLEKLDLPQPADPATYDKIIDLLVAGLRAILVV